METLQIKNHPAITKGYVERGDIVTSSDGVQRIKYVIHHSKDYELEIPVDKELEFLDEEDRFGTEMAASKARLEAAQAKYVYGTPELTNIQGLVFMALDGRDVSCPAWELIKKRLKEKK